MEICRSRFSWRNASSSRRRASSWSSRSTRTPKGSLRFDNLAGGGAVQFAPAVEGAVEIRGRFGNDGLQPGVAEPAGVGERREIELKNAASTLANFVARRFGKLNGVCRLGRQRQLLLVIGV